MRTSRALLAALAALATGGVAQAQIVRVAPGNRSNGFAYSYSMGDGTHARLGVNLASGSKRDTLGVLVSSIVEGGPAEKAGLEEGNRIAAINGVSLKLAAADAGEDDMGGVMTNRLMRELRKVKPGDEVTLTVYANGQTKTLKVKTSDAEEMSTVSARSATRMRSELEDRAVLGLNLGWGASRRDTLGVLIVGVEAGGPADKAGIEEGFRVAAINGTDLRVSAADAGDEAMAGIKASRFSRELQKLKAGDEVELKVYGNGRERTVRVKSVKSIDLYPHQRSGVRVFMNGNESMTMPPMPPMPAMAPMAPTPPPAPRELIRRMDEMREMDAEARLDETRAAVEAVHDRVARATEVAMARNGERVQAAQMRAAEAIARAQSFAGPRANSDATWVRDDEVGGRVNVTASGDNYTLVVRGMRLVPVTGDMTSYFGEGSDRGLLVLETGKSWTGLRDGDVILSVDGKSVRSDGQATIVLETDADNSVAILRKSKPLTVTVHARD